GYKQGFLRRFLPETGFALTGTVAAPGATPPPGFFISANPATAGQIIPFLTDQSTTRFSDHTAGYRLATTWGKKDSLNFTIGTDFTYLGQSQTENIVILDPQNRVNIDRSGVARQN